LPPAAGREAHGTLSSTLDFTTTVAGLHLLAAQSRTEIHHLWPPAPDAGCRRRSGSGDSGAL